MDGHFVNAIDFFDSETEPEKIKSIPDKRRMRLTKNCSAELALVMKIEKVDRKTARAILKSRLAN